MDVKNCLMYNQMTRHYKLVVAGAGTDFVSVTKGVFMFSGIQCVLLMTLLFASFAYAKGPGSTGGGKGCRADFMRSAFVTSQWLETNGSKLNPQISSNDFLVEVDPDKIVETPDEDLQDRGEPVSAYYDGEKIKVRCDRLEAETSDARQRVIAHEIFRKMGVEGDLYEVSRQIDIINSKSQYHVECDVKYTNSDLPARTFVGGGEYGYITNQKLDVEHLFLDASLMISYGTMQTLTIFDAWDGTRTQNFGGIHVYKEKNSVGVDVVCKVVKN